MPRARAESAPEWSRLYAIAEAQAGYITTAQAREALHYHVREARLQRVARGIYALTHFPAGEHEDLVVTWLWSGRQGVFSHETALALHELSDALPARMHITVSARWRSRRLRVPALTELYYDVDEGERAWVGPVAVTSALRTVLDCSEGGVDPGLVEQAIEEGLARGLFQKVGLRRALKSASLKKKRAVE